MKKAVENRWMYFLTAILLLLGPLIVLYRKEIVLEIDNTKILEEPPAWIQWTEEGESKIIAAIDEIQHPSSCVDIKWIAVEMDVSGLLWNLQSYVRALSLGVKLGRTVVPIAQPEGGSAWQYATFEGCDNKHLGCFFPNITSCWVEQHQQLQNELQMAEARTWDFECPEPCLHQNISELMNTRVLRLKPIRYEYPGWFVPVWNLNLWGSVLKAGDIYFSNMTIIRQVEQLRPSEPLFLLHAVVTRWLFKPTQHIVDLANQILDKHQGWSGPVVSMHIRQTDKKEEDTFWREHSHRYRSLSDYTDAATAAERRFGISWRTIYLLSDSEKVIRNMTAYYAEAQEVDVIYNDLLDRSVMEENGGHIHIPTHLKREMQNHFLASILAMASITDYAIGTLSSNVFRIIVQLLGGQGRIVQIDQVGPIAASLDSPGGWLG